MTNPYLIEGPALISFSGGRTSGYMLWHVLDAYDGKLPDNIHVCFANTGKEKEETLRFVHECGSRWGVRVRWLEFVTDLRRGGASSRFEEVGYNSASRKGEPLLRLIARKQAIFSTVSGRWCTDYCKVRVMTDFMESQGFNEGQFTEIIGFRADEYDRVIELPARPRNANRKLIFPMAKAKVRKSDVLAWWEHQPFDLQLQRGTGNCDQCPFLSIKGRIARARLSPGELSWWERLEVQHGGFSFGEVSFAQLARMVEQSPLLPMNETEADAAESECFGWCERDAA